MSIYWGRRWYSTGYQLRVKNLWTGTAWSSQDRIIYLHLMYPLGTIKLFMNKDQRTLQIANLPQFLICRITIHTFRVVIAERTEVTVITRNHGNHNHSENHWQQWGDGSYRSNLILLVIFRGVINSSVCTKDTALKFMSGYKKVERQSTLVFFQETLLTLIFRSLNMD